MLSVGYRLLNTPANLLAAAELRNHTLISSDEKRAGDKRLTIDKPMGSRNSSPMVSIKYRVRSHIMLTFSAAVA